MDGAGGADGAAPSKGRRQRRRRGGRKEGEGRKVSVIHNMTLSGGLAEELDLGWGGEGGGDLAVGEAGVADFDGAVGGGVGAFGPGEVAELGAMRTRMQPGSSGWTPRMYSLSQTVGPLAQP